MRSYWIMKGIKVIIFVAIAAVAFGFGVMYLWNWLMPVLFGLPVIEFWQAIGLVILGKLLFGGFHRGHCGCGRYGGHWRGHWKSRFERKLAGMSPEERAKYKKGFYERCGWWDSSWDEDAGEKKEDSESDKPTVE